jgi:hypothetical protein
LGTDRDYGSEGPCPCGNGKITIYRCSPDHPWGGEAWFENQLNCPNCNEVYQFYPSDDIFKKRSRLVLRKDVEDREARRKEWHKKTTAIMEMQAVQRILKQTQSALDQQRSMAAKYRLLRKYGLAEMSEGTFRRRFTGVR